MIATLVKKIVGSKNDREVKRLSKLVAQINAFEPTFEQLSLDQIREKTQELRTRLAKGAELGSLIPEAFALVREASKRVMGMRHFDVQMIGGMALNEGKIAEMRTGEGKTLVATLSAYLNALPAKGVHIVTVNDYLAERDAKWMRPLYEALGLTVGVIHSGQDAASKREAYRCDITYGTNNEFGFDYLRDNMALSIDDKMQPALHYAIVDEVDSILIDEARTPLIISGAAEDSSELYRAVNKLIPLLTEHKEQEEGVVEQQGHYVVDLKQRTVELNEHGHEYVEELLVEQGILNEGDSLYATTNLNKLHHVHQGLRAHVLFQRNVDYIVQGNQVVIVDEHTGRTMAGRRWSEGLHQAIEAKEGVIIQAESQTLASTTFQNYFRLYEKLSGMTGTADTEAFEFRQIYGLDVVVIPTNKPIARKDHNDLIYLNEEDKYNAIIEEIRECTSRGRPVLVGTASIEASERISKALNASKIKHNVLNAKQHEREAHIIAEAGRPSAVTIATNMAGRGTDIMLGGNWKMELEALEAPTEADIERIQAEWQKTHDQVLSAGGLHIIGTERHESRRIDNQLRGRSGRQGDPGSSRFFLSLEDPLMRIFASDRTRSMMQALGMKSGEAIEHKMVTNAIEKTQKRVEQRNFDIRKQLLEFDDVANEQRQAIYGIRNDLLAANDVSEQVTSMRESVVNQVVSNHIPPESLPEQWDVSGLEQSLKAEFAVQIPVQQWLDEDKKLHEEPLRKRLVDVCQQSYAEKEATVGAEPLRYLEKQVILQVLDNLWKEHLATLDHLRQGIHLRGYAQKNPKQEYKREAFNLFEELLNNIDQESIRFLSHVKFQQENEVEALERQRRAQAEAQAKSMQFEHVSDSTLG
jgi:preprotein translocase subunit SecA